LVRASITRFILKHAITSRPSGEWRDDDYNVLSDGAIGGIVLIALDVRLHECRMGCSCLTFREEPLAHRFAVAKAEPSPKALPPSHQ
jgi:hypothetical protein